MLINLIDNAIKFTPAEGSVQVRAYLVEADTASVYLSVTDTGRGISPESKALVFERLFQDPNAIDNSRKGLGLGLYIVQELVRLHGGRIWVESHPGHGSVFSFTLPLFSLSQILLPIITEHGHLRDALTLVSVDLAPQGGPGAGDWADTCSLCRELLRACIVPAKDVLLPALETAPARGNLLDRGLGGRERRRDSDQTHSRATRPLPGIEGGRLLQDCDSAGSASSWRKRETPGKAGAGSCRWYYSRGPGGPGGENPAQRRTKHYHRV